MARKKKADETQEKFLIDQNDYEIAELRFNFYRKSKEAPPTKEEVQAFEREIEALKVKKVNQYKTQYAKEHYKRLAILCIS